MTDLTLRTEQRSYNIDGKVINVNALYVIVDGIKIDVKTNKGDKTGKILLKRALGIADENDLSS